MRELACERLRRFAGILSITLWTLPSGCYLDHERRSAAHDGGAHDGGSGPVDAGASCRFAFTEDGERASCAISAGSTEACLEAALCVCLALLPDGTESEVLACAWWEVTPRGAITLADVCSLSLPALTTMDDALARYLASRGADADLETSPECSSVPALIGPSPIEPCGHIAERLCECTPGCDLEAALGADCLALGSEQADCIQQTVLTALDCSFVGELRAIVDACR